MKIVVFTHPDFLDSQSMPRYAHMLVSGMRERGHEVEVWTPKARFFKLPLKKSLKKWLAYLDQYIVFPLELKFRLLNYSKDTLFVFADQALGPWVPLVKNRPHVIHCHDFLALRSALGQVPENKTSKSGQIYQRFIRNGFSQGTYFLAISQRTLNDLHSFHQGVIIKSEVCYNSLNKPFFPINPEIARTKLGRYLKIDLSKGYILHVGGNQYYKNRIGVLEIYNAWRVLSKINLPLLMVGNAPSNELLKFYKSSAFQDDIYFISGLSDDYMNEAYSGACCLLFPSLDEGFGWPIAEAMASGCLVITTDVAPMTEVAGNAGFFLIPKRSSKRDGQHSWAHIGALQVERIKNLAFDEKEKLLNAGFENVKRFDRKIFFNQLENFYQSVLILQ